MKKQTREAGPWCDHYIYMGQDLPLYKNFYPFQFQLRKHLKVEPDDRTLMWVFDPEGSNGKTKFAKYMYFHHKVPFMRYGKTGDILNLASKFPGERAYIFDLSRAKPADFSNADTYSAMESIKDGYYINTKYDTKMICCRCPHVLVLANRLPDQTQCSRDRWLIVTINEDRKLVRYKNVPNVPSI